jgi:hypothetical protein
VRALKSELLEKIFFKGQAAGIGWWTFFYVAAFFVVNDPVEFRITYHLDYEVTGPASLLFNVAVAQNSFQRLITEHFEVAGTEPIEGDGLGMVFRMAHSAKSWRIFKAAVALHFVYNNFVQVHNPSA